MVRIVLDNGAGKVKYGVVGECEPRIMTNATAKINKSMQYLTGDQIDTFSNGSMLLFNRPFDRGYLNNWQCEIEVWNRALISQLKSKPSEDTLIVTEPLFNPESLQNDMNEVIFEYFEFNECLRRPAACFSAYEFSKSELKHNEAIANSCVVIDSGFSFSHAVPFVNGICQKHAVRRVNIGGKLLTNYLKEVVSYRQWNMMDEFVLMNQVKEDLCYMSVAFPHDIRKAKKTDRTAQLLDHQGTRLKKLFVLPDFNSTLRGYALSDDAQQGPEDQVLTMEMERFSVPELLFHPSDIGIDQAGVAEATWQSLQSLGQVEMGLAASNILLTGGNTKFPRFKQRFETEIRQYVPDIFTQAVHQPEDPETFAWRGASRFVEEQDRQGTLSGLVVSRAEYLEWGHSHCNDKFSSQW